jgi:hypothetical protein
MRGSIYAGAGLAALVAIGYSGRATAGAGTEAGELQAHASTHLLVVL